MKRRRRRAGEEREVKRRRRSWCLLLSDYVSVKLGLEEEYQESWWVSRANDETMELFLMGSKSGLKRLRTRTEPVQRELDLNDRGLHRPGCVVWLCL